MDLCRTARGWRGDLSSPNYPVETLQGKKLKRDLSYWYYDKLDHGDPKGSQAQTLVDYAATRPDGMDTIPLYMFYHPHSALDAAGALPAVEGINIRLARDVVGTVQGGCRIEKKKVNYWRAGFMSLSDLLCWPEVDLPTLAPPSTNSKNALSFGTEQPSDRSPAFHPQLVAERINLILGKSVRAEAQDFRASEAIPQNIKRAIAGEMTDEDHAMLKRPRVILSTSLTRAHPNFEQARAAVRRGDRTAISD